MLPKAALDRGATKMGKVQGAEMRVYGPVRPYLSVQVEVAV